MQLGVKIPADRLQQSGNFLKMEDKQSSHCCVVKSGRHWTRAYIVSSPELDIFPTAYLCRESPKEALLFRLFNKILSLGINRAVFVAFSVD